ncbi:MAG: DUF4276 family protein [Nitrospirae bacterium]|nr:DUF4276 family protein [Candidatus Troglogloeales bacterium]
MSEIVFFLEERSAEALLRTVIPRVLSPMPPCRYIVFEGKQDLDGRLIKKMKGYQVPGARFVVLRDQDASDCHQCKDVLLAKCKEAGRPDALIRIACRELESWYLADLIAVEKGLGLSGLVKLQQKSRFRSTDSIVSPAKELSRMAPSYQKIGGSRLIGPHLDIENTRSNSFQYFIQGIRRLGTKITPAQQKIAPKPE